MALRTQMEDMAERPRVGPVTFSPMPPAPPTGSRNTSIARARSMGHLRPRPLGSRTSGGHSGRSGARDHEGSGSDGECHGEDDEVRSLSLSEDGPVIRRSVSESGAGEDITSSAEVRMLRRRASNLMARNFLRWWT